MATDQEALSAGFILPAGTDPIRLGDDAIRQNARAATDIALAHEATSAKVSGLVPRLEKVESESADTGWIDISGQLLNGWTSNSGSTGVGVRRIGLVAYMRLRSLSGSAATGSQFWEAPAQFRPPSADGGIGLFGTANNVAQISIYSNGRALVSIPGSNFAAMGIGAAITISYLVG